MAQPEVTFIVSAFDRPMHLRGVLAALQIQTEPAIEVIVADNSPSVQMNRCNLEIIFGLNDDRFKYTNPRERTCYESSKLLAPLAHGLWLCFPHDDGYYVPGFAERMLRCAKENPLADFIYCDMLYDPRMFGEYAVCVTKPQCGFIDKGGFLIRRELFLTLDWPPSDGDIARDGLLVDELVRREIRMAKAPGVMWCHN